MTTDPMEAREIIRLTEVEGPQGVLRLISDHAAIGDKHNMVRQPSPTPQKNTNHTITPGTPTVGAP